jgi:hypothetical protein
MPTGANAPNVCQWMHQSEALKIFAGFAGKTQSAGHILPLHWYVACRLVIEGGFRPEDIMPRSVTSRGNPVGRRGCRAPSHHQTPERCYE